MKVEEGGKNPTTTELGKLLLAQSATSSSADISSATGELEQLLVLIGSSSLLPPL